MGTTRLQIYNAALLLCGAEQLSALTDDGEARRRCDQVWDNNFIRKVLQAGQWNFATRTQQLDYDTTVTTQFGYTRAFVKGDDWVRTMAVCSDEFFNSPLIDYQDEGGYIFADLDTIYVRFVSDDGAYGSDLSTWPDSFQQYAEAFMASKIIFRLTSDKQRLLYLLGDPGRNTSGHLEKMLKNARSDDAMRDPTTFPPSGSWVASRGSKTSRRGPFGDGGTTNSLTG